MLNPYFTQRNEIPAQSDITWNVQGYSGMGLDVSGTITSGSFTLQGTNDGVTWTNCKFADDSTATVSATGHYTVRFLGFNIVKLVPSALDADITLTAVGTVEVPASEA